MSSFQKRLKVIAALGATLAGASCFLVDLSELSFRVEPCQAWSVLPAADARIGVDFDFEPERLDAERAFSVQGPDGAVPGDFSWDGRRMTWKASASLVPRRRYRLLFRGAVRESGGAQCVADCDLPFWLLSAGEPPKLLELWPLDGASVYPGQAGSLVLEARFSEAMDTMSVRRAFSCSPELDATWEWSESMDVLRLVARSALEPCETYRWTISREAMALDGSPLGGESSGRFFTDADISPPAVLYARPVREFGDGWVELADGLDGLGSGDAIGLWFSEPVDEESVYGNARLEPGPRVSIAMAGSAMAVLTPEVPWPPNEALCLVVDADVRDLSGLRMAEPWKETFTAAVPSLRLLSLESGDGESLANPKSGDLLAMTVGPEPEGVARLILKFSDGFDAASMALVPDMLRLSVLFPASAPLPSRRSVAWDGYDTLSVEWEGLSRSDDQAEVFYRLSLKGGMAGPLSLGGLRMASELVVYLEAKP